MAVDISLIAIEAVSSRLMVYAHALSIATGLTVYDAMYQTLVARLLGQSQAEPRNGSSNSGAHSRLDHVAFCLYPPTRGAQLRDQPYTTSAQVRRYSGLRRSNIVARIEQALRECGAEILVRADPSNSPI